MKPKVLECPPEDDLFRSRLDNIINLRHELGIVLFCGFFIEALAGNLQKLIEVLIKISNLFKTLSSLRLFIFWLFCVVTF